MVISKTVVYDFPGLNLYQNDCAFGYLCMQNTFPHLKFQALEGGYNLNSISLSMTMVTKALLGDPMPHLAPYR